MMRTSIRMQMRMKMVNHVRKEMVDRLSHAGCSARLKTLS